MPLFSTDYGPEDESPLEDVEITTTILYFSTEQLARFKYLAKKGIKEMYKEDFQQKGNLPIFILNILEKLYGDESIQTTSEPSARREAEVQIPDELEL